MAFKSRLLSCAVFMLLNYFCHSQTIDSSYEVAAWPQFRSGAVSFTFDDGCANQFAVAMPMFDKYNFKTTFFTVINWSPNWRTLKTAAANGHEIASHTLSHGHLGAMTNDQQISELRDSQKDINTNVTEQKCLTIAYPYCELGNSSICKQYYIAARGCSGVVEPKTPANLMNISSIICGSLGSVQRTSDFTSKINATVNAKGWVVFLIHGVDNDGGYSLTTSTELKGALDFLETNKNKFWVATFSDAARYIRERNAVSVKETVVKDSALIVSITDTLDNSIYNLPVTIRRSVPNGWDSLSVTRNGKVVNYQITDVNSKKYLMFDVVPDSGDLLIKKINVTDVSGHSSSLILEPYLKQNYPNPFNPVTTIDYQISQSSFVTLKMYDTLGREIKTLVNTELSPGNYSVKFDGTGFPSGFYFYSLRTDKYCNTKKLVLMK
jgi:oligosaccharide reducing-end xylanase